MAVLVAMMPEFVWSQSAPAADPNAAKADTTGQVTAAAQGGTISGSVKSGNVPLPGVAVTATNTLTGKKYATTTDVTGAFSMAIPRNGRYVVKAELSAFATATQEVLLNAAGLNGGKPAQTAQFGMELASRAAAQEATQQAQQTAAAGAIGRGLQSLSLQGGAGDTTDASVGGGNSGCSRPEAGVGRERAGMRRRATR